MTKRLRDLSPEAILQELENRSEALVKAEEYVAELETSFKALESSLYAARRNHGMSQGDAEKALRGDPGWTSAYLELNKAVIAEKEARRSYQRAEKALELWRTEQSTLRAIEK